MLSGAAKGGDQLLATFDPQSLHVLVVDSKAASRQSCEQLLRECSYQVTTAKTSKEAIVLLQEECRSSGSSSVQLILKEHEPPHANACRLLKQLQTREALACIPVVVMSEQDDRETVATCLMTGAADFLVKPLRHNELRNLWTRVWWRVAKFQASAYAAGLPPPWLPPAPLVPLDSADDSHETKCDDDESEPTSREGSAPGNGNGHDKNGKSTNGCGSGGHGDSGNNGNSGNYEASAVKNGHNGNGNATNGNGSSADKPDNGNSATKNGVHSNGHNGHRNGSNGHHNGSNGHHNGSNGHHNGSNGDNGGACAASTDVGSRALDMGSVPDLPSGQVSAHGSAKWQQGPIVPQPMRLVPKHQGTLQPYKNLPSAFGLYAHASRKRSADVALGSSIENSSPRSNSHSLSAFQQVRGSAQHESRSTLTPPTERGSTAYSMPMTSQSTQQIHMLPDGMPQPTMIQQPGAVPRFQHWPPPIRSPAWAHMHTGPPQSQHQQPMPPHLAHMSMFLQQNDAFAAYAFQQAALSHSLNPYNLIYNQGLIHGYGQGEAERMENGHGSMHHGEPEFADPEFSHYPHNMPHAPPNNMPGSCWNFPPPYHPVHCETSHPGQAPATTQYMPHMPLPFAPAAMPHGMQNALLQMQFGAAYPPPPAVPNHMYAAHGRSGNTASGHTGVGDTVTNGRSALLTIGSASPTIKERRKQAVDKFREKKKERKTLNFDKRVRYEARKQIANRRPRVKGMFVSHKLAADDGMVEATFSAPTFEGVEPTAMVDAAAGDNAASKLPSNTTLLDGSQVCAKVSDAQAQGLTAGSDTCLKAANSDPQNYPHMQIAAVRQGGSGVASNGGSKQVVVVLQDESNKPNSGESNGNGSNGVGSNSNGRNGNGSASGSNEPQELGSNGSKGGQSRHTR